MGNINNAKYFKKPETCKTSKLRSNLKNILISGINKPIISKRPCYIDKALQSTISNVISIHEICNMMRQITVE